MSDLQSTIAKKRQNSDSTFKVSPFQSVGFGVQAKSAESIPATKAELWNSYQQAKNLNQKGANPVPAPILPIQTKLTVGKAGDKYEQEADSMAAQVMAMPESGHVQREELAQEEELQMKPLGAMISPLVQRDALPEEEDEIQTKPLAATISPLVQREALPEEEELQMKPCDNVIQRELAPEEDDEPELQMKPLGSSIQRETLPEVEEEIQTKQLPEANSQAPTTSLENRLSSSKGGGNPLSENVRSFMEPRFGADFSGVRVHMGSDAVQMNQSVNAQAFAHGQDIYFGAGKSPGNNDLTAHELTHTIQQTGGLQKRSLGKFRKHNKIQAKLDSTSPIVQRKENPPPQSEQNQPSPQQTDSAPTNSGVGQQSVPSQSASPAPGGEGKQATPQDSTPTSSGQQTGTSPVSNVSQSSATADGGSQPASGGTDLTLDGGKQADTGGSSATSAENDPGFKAVTERTKHSAKAQKEHPPAGAKSAEAQAAAIAPSNEVEAKAQDRQVQEMNQQQPGQFNAAKFKAALMEKIESKVPKNLEEVNNFKNQNQLDAVRGDVSTQVKSEQQQAAGGIEEKTKEQPNTASIPPKLVTPIPPAQSDAKPPDVGAADAAPKPKTASEVSLQEDSQALDKQMTNADVSEEQLASSNEPEFQTALGSKQSTQTHANTAPVVYRQQEGVIVTQAQATAQTTAQNQLQGMHGDKNKVLSTVFGQQGQAKGQDEAKRTEVASHIQNIYGKTKQEVNKILGELDSQVTPLFDQGAATAKSIFENHVDQEMTRYKDERYSGLWGKKRWLTDKLHLTTLPDAVNKFYEAGKKLYLNSIGKTIDRIATLVSSKLNAATAEIAKGKQEIQQYVAKLDPSLKEVGKEAAQDIQGKFDELTESIDNKQNELIDSLAQKYQENLQGINARIDEMKQANRSLFDMAKDAIGGVIKTILELKNMLMSTLAKAGSAISKIIKDPIGFLGNLVAGVKQGFMNFAGNIFEHLKKGLLGWLTGALGGSGIQMPENFDMKGIFSLVMQVLGMTYQNIRGKAADKLGEKAVNKLEASFEWFIILKEQGLVGLWEHIQEKIGDLKTMVLDNIQNFVIESIVKAGVTWVLSLLNPASAFIKACKAIYDIVMFFIERGSQIMELVNAVIDSVTAIANGSIGSAATFIENALSKALPVVISFMASLLGLGGISEKIQSIVKTVQTPINKAIDWVIGKGAKAFKTIGNKFKNSKLGKKVNSVKDAAKEKYKAGKQWGEDKKEAGKKWIEDKKEKAHQWAEDKKAAVAKKVEENKKQFFNTKVGQKLLDADQWGQKQIEKLENKKKALHEKLNSAKDWSHEKLTNGKNKLKQTLSGVKNGGKAGNTGEDKYKQNKASTTDDSRSSKSKQNDLDAAQKVLQEIIAKSENSKQVEQSFPTIKQNFGLKKLEWSNVGTPSACIIMEVNPRAIINLSNSKLILSEGDTTHSNRFKQDVSFETSMIDGKYTVGKRMEAKKLGPNHPQGSPPLGGALSELMKKMDTNPYLQNHEKYIKGHLLNDNLGGPGSVYNLYPITAAANKMHEQNVESSVKDWVNNKGYWVYYKVEITNETINLADGQIDADIACEAAQLDVDGNKVLKGAIKKTIRSEIGKQSSIKDKKINKDKFSNKEAKPVRSFDPDKVEYSSRK